MKAKKSKTYQRACLKLVFSLLTVWFLASFGCGILFRDWLDVHAPPIGNAPFGFWMAQQGSIIIFVFILVVYAATMDLLDTKYGYAEKD
jgi:putative solute:sodium symporter small subunit